ncbi:hypothetical protein [Streptomyces sp. DSM 40750]|uniref:hypothetical protein n=1 Tax=Streptomyces sp. DSM 40750 TaxID=2801030 RepID=UPI00214C039A|nr:hypothetical protein [Streptomyces sp. DSM 40750]UUU24601.1 hypothetical protein JIX55_32530 [Streptomyces sp. DSM 40750]
MAELAEPLPPAVAATLNALLTAENPVGSALRAQIPYAHVVGGCGCGCATVDLAVDREAVPPAPTRSDGLAADAWYVTPDDAGVMVFTQGGYLSLLEIYSAAPEPVTAWPEPRFVERA